MRAFSLSASAKHIPREPAGASLRIVSAAALILSPARAMWSPVTPATCASLMTCLAKASPHSRKASPPSPTQWVRPAWALRALPIFSISPLAFVSAAPLAAMSAPLEPMMLAYMLSADMPSKLVGPPSADISRYPPSYF
ncbi:hypothetical protein AC230_18990 [Streptomyces caatingaensis]|uniref:Uncharacterized protein n=1 Tax=Streptomyces caatingaensis TaxID=1678637 RepID=A0A0K9XCV6_9ACTN|nr:hypothetical protein AC230_18990 [Streptomyces caatingaensis]